MSNERIDLTQFEGVKAPWEYNTDDDGWTLATIHERDNPDRDEFIVLMRKPNGGPLLTMNPNLSAITMVPDLIAELKRCYEKLDMAESALTEIWAHHIDSVGGYNVSEILYYYEKAHGLNIRPDASE